MLNIDPDNYVSAKIFKQDISEIFLDTWQLLCPVSRLAERGDYYAAEISGQKVFAIQTSGGIRAFKNVCRHRGARLLQEGCGRSSTIRCPYHQWVWGENGELLHVPWWGNDPGFDSKKLSLDKISYEIWRGLLFISIEPSITLSEQLAGLVSELEGEEIDNYHWVHEEKLTFDSNWKIYTDNFVEGYHIPGIHPSFYEGIEFEKFETLALDGYVRMTAPPRKGLFYRGKWLWMWPNWTLSLFEGGMNTSRINPINHKSTELIYNFFFADSSNVNKDKRDKIIKENLDVIREDFEVCIEIHKNYESGGYRAGPLSPRHEQGVAYFQKRLIESRVKGSI